MSVETIFTVKDEHLNQLNERTAVAFFQELLWAEARRLGIEISKINISNQVTVPDGGIDAVVVKNNTSTTSGLIKSGKTNYQIKSGKKKPNVKDELFGEGKERDKKNLKEGIQACLETCETYVLVCTGVDFVDRDHRKILIQIKDYLVVSQVSIDSYCEKWLKEGDSEDLFSTAAEKGTLTFIPREKIWEWIDEDVENRAWYFAYRLVSKTLSAGEWQDSLVRAFLVGYGDREDVRRNLRANYSTESWTGERSLHLESKKNKLLRIKEDEDNVKVKQWLNEFIDELEEDIERARIEEEREF